MYSNDIMWLKANTVSEDNIYIAWYFIWSMVKILYLELIISGFEERKEIENRNGVYLS
jgi:hypothetical protein